jgi:hypothetical protein
MRRLWKKEKNKKWENVCLYTTIDMYYCHYYIKSTTATSKEKHGQENKVNVQL